MSCHRQVFTGASVKPKVLLCWFHVKRNWLENCLKMVKQGKGRRQELLQRCDAILRFNPGPDAGETCIYRAPIPPHYFVFLVLLTMLPSAVSTISVAYLLCRPGGSPQGGGADAAAAL